MIYFALYNSDRVWGRLLRTLRIATIRGNLDYNIRQVLRFDYLQNTLTFN
ncbi:MAG: hypothetical protein KDD15_18995 [Lewinella sp.]|nr:hypothetical protein [Lewinella sp.]